MDLHLKFQNSKLQSNMAYYESLLKILGFVIVDPIWRIKM